MRAETLALHAGFDADPATRAVAVPIYQTAAYQFDSADQGAALFNLEEEGFRYSRIANPTVAVLEERVAALEGAPAGWLRHRARRRCIMPWPMWRSPAPISCRCRSFTAPPTPCCTPCCRGRAWKAALPPVTAPTALEACIDDKTCAVFCETVGNPAGNICDIAAIAAMAHARGIPLIVDNTVATPGAAEAGRAWRRHHRAFADQVHGRPWQPPWAACWSMPARLTGWRMRHAFRNSPRPMHSYHGLVYAQRFPRTAFHRPRPQRLPAHHRRHPVTHERLPAAAGHRDRMRCASSAMSRTAAVSRNSCAPMTRVDPG